MPTISLLSVKYGVDTTELKKGMSNANDEAERGKGIFSGLGDALGTVGKVAAGAALAGVIALGGILIDSVHHAMELSAAHAQLAAAIADTGVKTGVTVPMLDRLTESIISTVPVSEEAAIAAETMLGHFSNIGKNIFPQVTMAALDVSQALGKDLTASTRIVGQAINDPIKGLTSLGRIGITFTANQKAMVKQLMASGDTMGAQKILLDALSASYGGAAEAAGKTLPGQLAILNNQFSKMKDEVGSAVIPILTSLMNTAILPLVHSLMADLPGAIAYVQNLFTQMQPSVHQLVIALTPIGEWLENALPVAGRFLAGVLQNVVIPVLTNLANFLSNDVIPAIQTVASWISTTAIPALERFGQTIEQKVQPWLLPIATAITTQIVPALQTIGSWLLTTVIPALQQFGGMILQIVWPALQQIGGALSQLGPPFSQLGIALQNLGIALEPLAPLVKILAEVLGGSILIGLTIIMGVINGLAHALGGIITALSGVVQYVSGALELLVGLFTGNSQKIQKGWTDMGNGIKTIVTGLISAVLGFFTGLGTTLGSTIDHFTNGALSKFGSWAVGMILHAINLVLGVENWIATLPSRVWSFLENMIGGALSRMASWVGGMITNAVSMESQFLGALASMPGKLWDLGVQAMNSLKNAIGSMVGDLVNAAVNAGEGILNGIKQALHIGSPSRDMIELGEMTMQGMAEGMKRVDLQAALDLSINPLVNAAKVGSPENAAMMRNMSPGSSGWSSATPAAANAAAGNGKTYNINVYPAQSSLTPQGLHDELRWIEVLHG